MRKSKKPLRWFESILLHGFRWTQKHPRVTVTVTILALAASCSGLGRTKQVLNIDELITADFSTAAALKTLQDTFRQSSNMTMTLIPTAPWTERDLCAITAAIKATDLTLGAFERIDSPLLLRKAQSEPDRLLFPQIVPTNCVEPTTAPADFSALTASPWNGLIWNSADQALTFEFTLRSPLNLKDAAAARADLTGRLTAELAPAPKMIWGGSAVFQNAMQDGYRITDALNLLLAIAVSIVYRYLFGTWKSSLVFFGTLIPVTLSVQGLMGWLGWPIDLLSNALFMILLIACVEDFIFLAGSQLSRPDKPWRSHIRRIMVPSFLTSFTTCMGFVSLASSDLQMIGRFGFMTGLGAILEWTILFIFMPALLTMVPGLRVWAIPRPGVWRAPAFVRATRAWLTSYTPPPRLGAVLVGLGALGLFSLPHLHIDDSPLQIFPRAHELRLAEDYFLGSRGWSVDVSLIFNDKNDLAGHRDVLEKLRQDPLVRAADSHLGLHEFLTAPGATGNRKDLIWLTSQEHPSLQRYFGSDVVGGGVIRTMLFLGTDRVQEVNRLRAKVDELCAGRCVLGGSLVSYAEFGERVPRFLLESLLLSLLTVSATLAFLAWGKNSSIIAVVVSSLWGPLLLLLLLGVGDIQIYFVTTIFASVLIGMTGDNGIQFLYHAQNESLEQGVDRKADSALHLMGILVMISLLFALSPFVPLRILGALFAVGCVLSYLGDVLVLKFLLRSFRRGE